MFLQWIHSSMSLALPLIPSCHPLTPMPLPPRFGERKLIKASLAVSVGCHLVPAPTSPRFTPSFHPTPTNWQLDTSRQLCMLFITSILLMTMASHSHLMMSPLCTPMFTILLPQTSRLTKMRFPLPWADWTLSWHTVMPAGAHN